MVLLDVAEPGVAGHRRAPARASGAGQPAERLRASRCRGAVEQEVRDVRQILGPRAGAVWRVGGPDEGEGRAKLEVLESRFPWRTAVFGTTSISKNRVLGRTTDVEGVR